MSDFEAMLKRWQTAGALNAEAAARIRTWEEQQLKPSGLRWQGMVALILGAMLLACGVVLFVSAHWDGIGPFWRYLLVIGMVTLFHLAGPVRARRFAGSQRRCMPWERFRPGPRSRSSGRSSTSRRIGRLPCCCGPLRQ